MIWYYGLKDSLLKAINLRKNRQNLVKVQRMVNKPGVSPYLQYFWVRPNQVKSTDKVVAGHRNLLPEHPLKKVLFSPTTKRQTNDYFRQFASVKDAFSSLKLMGITWNESSSPGVNLIRAKIALNTAIHNGFIIPDNSGVKNDDLVQLPIDATPRQQKLAALINNMTDIDVIKKCSIIGMVPEDETAERFITDFLVEKLVNSTYLLPPRVYDQIRHETKILDLPLSNAFLYQRKIPYIPLLVEGVYDSDKETQTFIKDKLEHILNFPILDALTDPQKYLDPNEGGLDGASILSVLNKHYGEDTDDPMSDGFVKVLQQIKQNNPEDTEISQKVDNMIETYRQLCDVAARPPRSETTTKKRTEKISSWVHSVDYDTLNMIPVPPDSSRAQLYQLIHKLFGNSVTIQLNGRYTWDKKPLSDVVQGTPVSFNRADKVIFANLILTSKFLSEIESNNIPLNFNVTIPYSLSQDTQSQLKSLLMYSPEDIDKVDDFFSKDSLAKKNVTYWDLQRESLDSFLEYLDNSPLKHMIHKNLSALLSFVPDATKVDSDKLLQPLLALREKDVVTPLQLQQARQYLFQFAKLSLATESHEVSDKMRADILSNRFDYKPGEKDQSGYVYKSPRYDGSVDDRRFALFNSRFFKINNSIWEERMTAKKHQLQSNYPDHPEYYEVQHGFHGTSYWSAINILGRDGEFAINPEETEIQTKNGTALGKGIYLADKLGKSLPYIGNDSYSMLSHDGGWEEDDANGIALMVDYVRGDRIEGFPGQKLKLNNKSTCILGSPANCGFKASEIVISNNAQVCPQYLVDVSGRILSDFDEDEENDEDYNDEDYDDEDYNDEDYDDEDYAIPYRINRDWNGNFVNRAGDIIYTADHKSVNMM